MRALVLALALFAALKIWVQDSVYRSATEAALVSAYRARAADVCARISPKTLPASGTAPAVDWSHLTEPQLKVGNPAIQVRIWEFDHELWNARFRQPYLIFAPARAGLSCTYDILADTAEIVRS